MRRARSVKPSRKRSKSASKYSARRYKTRVAPPGYQSFNAIARTMEKKFIDLTLPTGPINNTNYGTASAPDGYIQYLHTIPVGSGMSQRVGNKVTLTNINIHGNIYNATVTSGTNDALMVRAMLVLDTQVNGAAFKASDLLVSNSFLAFRNIPSGQRFVVLREKILTYNFIWNGAATGGTASCADVDRKFSMSWRGKIPLTFSADAGDVGTCKTNGVFLVLIPEVYRDAGTIPHVYLRSRCKYTDL